MLDSTRPPAGINPAAPRRSPRRTARPVPSASPVQADELAAVREAVAALLARYYPGCVAAALVLEPGPDLPSVVIRLAGHVPSNVLVDDLA
jgi:hypothetical protein